MKRLLYIGHYFHNKTQSTQFLQDIFKEEYEVEKFDFDPYNDSFDKLSKLKGKCYDVVILFQIMPPVKKLKKFINWKNIAFFPMYDATNNLDELAWYEYRNCNIINFSKTLHEKCVDYGFSSYYIQYFPQVAEIKDWGNEKSIFFWQRINKINPDTIEALINPQNVERLHIHDVPDPDNHSIQPSEKWANKVSYSTWFDTKQEMLDHLQKFAIYIAPREYEGFGTSYLDAMANGRCVIALDNPAMNEYIVNGQNGFLYSLDNLHEIDINDIRSIQHNTYEYMKAGRKKWDAEKANILEWIKTPVIANKKLIDRKYRQLRINTLMQNIFSVKNSYFNSLKYKVITLCGLRVCLKKKDK